MKQRQLVCAAAVLALWLAAAPGAAENAIDSETVGDNNQVTIHQIGVSLTATIRSGNDVGDTDNVVNVTQTSAGNEAIIMQVESMANVVVTQSGSGNFGQLSQAHSDIASLLQTGNDNTAEILQLGVASLGSTGGNEALIAQPGGANTGVIIQRTERPCDADESCVDDALGNAASIDQTGVSDLAQILQTGEANHVSAIQDVTSQSNSTLVVQEGTDNIADVFHTDLSEGNTAAIGQIGSANLVEVFQSDASALNLAVALQNGIANNARVLQAFESLSNTANVEQTGDQNLADIFQQTSESNAASIEQSGNANVALVDQDASLSNSASVTQSGTANLASVLQELGASNSAVLQQSGDGNVAELTQGSGDSATISQIGSGHNISITQGP